MITDTCKASLLLEDGTVYEGYSFGKAGRCVGELVYNTAATGYEEALTDPGSYGQILVQTFPLIGNYGVNNEDPESEKCYLPGYIVREWCEVPSNFRCTGTIDSYLKEHGVVGLWGIDTRALTKKLREAGSMRGMILSAPVGDIEAALEEIRAFTIKGAIRAVSATQEKTFPAQGEEKHHVALLDLGCKYAVRRALCARGCRVTVLPYDTSSERVKALGADGLVIAGGPEAPFDEAQTTENIKQMTGLGIPVFGICLGHLVLALANGCALERLKNGHSGENQPVREKESAKIYITAQSHAYTVKIDSLKAGTGVVSYENVNDHSCEGIEYKTFDGFSVQFHPEACGGPQDTEFLFDRFVRRMGGAQ